MSLLDDARRLVDGPCPTYWDVELTGTVGRLGPDQGTVLKCAHCRQKLHTHGLDCPWLSMPKIVAALEELGGVNETWDDQEVLLAEVRAVWGDQAATDLATTCYACGKVGTLRMIEGKATFSLPAGWIERYNGSGCGFIAFCSVACVNPWDERHEGVVFA